MPEFARVEREEMLRGTGLGEEGIRRPQIGVVSSWGEVNPGSVHLDKISRAVKDGIWAAGGTPREFVISSICTSMASHDNYHLPHRDLVAGYIETVALDLLVNDVEMQRRRQAWRAPELRIKKGYLLIYSRMVGKTSRGASLRYGSSA